MAETEPGQDFGDADDPRLAALDQRLAKAKAEGASRQGVKVDADRGYSRGSRVISALIGSLVGSALIGWLFDRWFGTAPSGPDRDAVPGDRRGVQADHSDFW